MSAGAPAIEAADQRRNPAATMLLLGLIGLASVLVVIGGFAAGVSGDNVPILLVGVLIGAIALIPPAIDQGRAPKDRHPILFLFCGAYFVYFVPPIFTRYLWGDPHAEGPTQLVNIAAPDILAGQLTTLLALLLVYVGYAWPLGGAAARMLPKPRYDWSHQISLMIAMALIPVGWFVFVLGNSGLLPAALGTGGLGVFATGTYFGIGLLLLIQLRYKSQPARLLIFILVPASMLVAFLTGSKRFMFSPLIVLLISYFVVERRIKPSWILVGFLLLVIIYPTMQFWRQFVLAGYQLTAMQVLQNPGRAITLMSVFVSTIEPADYLLGGLRATGSRMDALGILTVIVRDTPDIVPFQGGWTIGNVFISFIPRILWPGKPIIGIGQWITENYGAPDVSSSTGSTWIGEFYLNFGYLGVVVGMLIIGIYFRILHETLFRGVRTIPGMMAGVVVVWTTTTTLEMNLIAPFTGTIFTLIPIVLTHMALRAFAPEHLVPPQSAESAPPMGSPAGRVLLK